MMCLGRLKKFTSGPSTPSPTHSLPLLVACPWWLDGDKYSINVVVFLVEVDKLRWWHWE